MCAFILACGGRIVGKIGTEYETVPSDKDEVLEYLDIYSLNEELDEDSPTAFEEIIQVAGLYDRNVVEEDLKDKGVVGDDDLKNSAPKSEDV